jgi:hypothetical protein
MVAQLGYLNSITKYFVDDSVFIIDTAGPISGECVFQRFGLADAFKGPALDLIYQPIDTAQDFCIGLLPVKVILPGII